MVTGFCATRSQYWQKLDGLPTFKGVFRKALAAPSSGCCLSQGSIIESFIALLGSGSLGRERYVGIAMCRGGRVAREAKALAPSACVWAAIRKGLRTHPISAGAGRIGPRRGSLRSIARKWIVRRLAPDCSRVELASMPKERDESKLLRAMGFETANVHLGTPRAGKLILRDLGKRPADWLHRSRHRHGEGHHRRLARMASGIAQTRAKP